MRSVLFEYLKYEQGFQQVELIAALLASPYTLPMEEWNFCYEIEFNHLSI